MIPTPSWVSSCKYCREKLVRISIPPGSQAFNNTQIAAVVCPYCDKWPAELRKT